MKFALLGSVGSWHSSQLLAAAAQRGHLCVPADFETLSVSVGEQVRVRCRDVDLSQLDAVLVRMMPPGSLEQVVTRMNLLHLLASRGTRIVNPPAAVECAIDKGLTTARLAQQGLPVPRTIVCETVPDARRGFEELDRNIVLKPLFGSEGRGIVRITDLETLQRICGGLQHIRAVFYLQEFLPHDGSDIRVLVLDGEVLGAIQRRNPFDFRTNVALQATASAHQPTDEECDLAIRAAGATGCCFAGVDLLYDARGRCHVIEVNAVPGWKAFQQVTGIPVAERLLGFLERT